MLCVLKKKKLEKQSVDFSKDLINLSRVELKNKDRFKKIDVLENEIPISLIVVEILCCRRSAGKIATDSRISFG